MKTGADMSDSDKSFAIEQNMYRIINRVLSEIPEVVESTSEGFQSFMTDISSALGRKVYKGIYLKKNKSGIFVIVSVSIIYGVSVPDVAEKIQHMVKAALESEISDSVLGVDVVITKIIK